MRSMTGYGHGSTRKDGWEVTAEIRSVNHRFLDINTRLPRNLSFLEQSIRATLSEMLRRGHLDVFLTVRSMDESALTVTADYDLAGHYMKIAEEMSRRTGTANDVTVSRLIQMEGVTAVSEREMDQEKITEICRESLQEAAGQLIKMREREGENLEADLRLHLDAIRDLRAMIAERAPNVVLEYKEKLEIRLNSLIHDAVDPQRLAQEVAIAADRCAIDEELSRLESHIRQMDLYLKEKNEIGKKMDFLIQEMNRETNTIGSKASDAAIAGYVVEMKSEIEKMREQIQNVE